LTRFLQRAGADTSGAAAVEFAVIFPVLFVLHVAAAEALEAYKAQRNVAHIAAAMADITAQSRSVTTAEINDILAASTAIIHPFPTTGMQQRVTSLSASAGGTVTQDWQVKKTYTLTGAASVPSGYLSPGESVIVTEVVYDYRPTFGLFLPETIRFIKRGYARPRLSTKVEKLS